MAKTKAETGEAVKTFQVVASSMLDANGNFWRQGDIVSASQIGNVDLHLERGAIVEVQLEVKAEG